MEWRDRQVTPARGGILPVTRWFPAGWPTCSVRGVVVPGWKTGAVRIGVPCIRGIYRVHRMIIKYTGIYARIGDADSALSIRPGTRRERRTKSRWIERDEKQGQRREAEKGRLWLIGTRKGQPVDEDKRIASAVRWPKIRKRWEEDGERGDRVKNRRSDRG